MASNFKFEILQHLCVLSDKGNNWRREVNLVRWNDGVPKFDIRDWSYDRTQMSKGITLTKNEFLNLSSNIRYVKLKLWDQVLNEQQNKAQNVNQNVENNNAQFAPFAPVTASPESGQTVGASVNIDEGGSVPQSSENDISKNSDEGLSDIPPVPEIPPEENTMERVFSQQQDEKMASGM